MTHSKPGEQLQCWDMEFNHSIQYAEMVKMRNGRFVRFEDAAELQRRVEALERLLESVIDGDMNWHEIRSQLKAIAASKSEG